MAHLKIQPPGQVPLNPQDRKPIIKVIGGDSWHVSTNLFNPACPAEPANPDNTIVEVKLAETQFDNALWSGGWFEGVLPDKTRKGLCHINIPKEITKNLRRGSYMFSVRVSDILKTTTITEADGSFLVEYKVTSDQHSIPYKDGTSKSSSGDSVNNAGSITEDTLKSINEALVSLKKEISALKSGKIDKDALDGKSFDISKMKDVVEAAGTVADALGADVSGISEEQQGG